MKLNLCAVLVLLVGHGAMAAEEIDISSLYEVSTEGSSRQVRSGEAGKLVIAIQTRPGAHISEEAPLKIELSCSNVTPAKSTLARTDSVAVKQAGQEFVDPRFEVPFTPGEAGKGQLDARMTFFVCTEKICARQQRKVSVPVEIDSSQKVPEAPRPAPAGKR